MEHNLRHRFLWRLLRPLVMLIVWIRFGYRGDFLRLDAPSIVVSNHVTDWDPLLLGCSFRSQMYFVGSEHILRLGFVSKLLNWLVAPIGRQKGGSAAGAVRGILRTVKGGFNVAFFPEGNRSWTGKTGIFPPATGKLIRTAGCSLVTFRLSGGYFSSPRWSGDTARRGRMDGRIVHVYSKEELRGMTAEEINRRIAEDIGEDAYARQEETPVRYRGRRRAEHLESLLYLCPSCGAAHRLESAGNTFRCSACGASAEYTEEGFLDGDFRFRRIDLWAEWQAGELSSHCGATAPEDAVFSDGDLRLFSVDSGKSREELGSGTAVLYRDRFVLPADLVLPLSVISGMALRGYTDLYIGTSDGKSYLLKGGPAVCMHKYLEACIILGCPVEYGV